MLACVFMLPRRHLLRLATAFFCLTFLLPSAHASIARAIRLADLVRASQHVVVGIPDSSFSRWENVAGSKRIVTYTRVRVEETVAGVPSGAELMVRTMGGHVGKIGQIVHGEAVLKHGERSLLFVRPEVDGRLAVAAMAQGHYPVRADRDGSLKVTASPSLAKLLGPEGSAVARLSGQTLSACQRLIHEAARK
jgi:hypothetical protein